MFSQPEPQTYTDRCEEIVDLPISLEVIIFEEITEAINQLKSGKAPGYNKTDAEMLKAEKKVI